MTAHRLPPRGVALSDSQPDVRTAPRRAGCPRDLMVFALIIGSCVMNVIGAVTVMVGWLLLRIAFVFLTRRR